MELVTLARFFNPAEAELMASRLRAADFDVVVAHDGPVPRDLLNALKFQTE